MKYRFDQFGGYRIGCRPLDHEQHIPDVWIATGYWLLQEANVLRTNLRTFFLKESEKFLCILLQLTWCSYAVIGKF